MTLTVFNYDKYMEQKPSTIQGMITRNFEFTFECDNTGDEDLPAPKVTVMGYYIKFKEYSDYLHYVLLDTGCRYIIPDKAIDHFDHVGIRQKIERIMDDDR